MVMTIFFVSSQSTENNQITSPETVSRIIKAIKKGDISVEKTLYYKKFLFFRLPHKQKEVQMIGPNCQKITVEPIRSLAISYPSFKKTYIESIMIYEYTEKGANIYHVNSDGKLSSVLANDYFLAGSIQFTGNGKLNDYKKFVGDVFSKLALML